MKPIVLTKKQFVMWLIVTAGALTLFMLGDDSLATIAFGILAFSQFIIMTPAERSRPLARRDFLLITIVLLAFVCIGLVIGRVIPKGQEEAVVRFMRHPAFVIPFWVLCVWMIYRRWRLPQAEGQNERNAA